MPDKTGRITVIVADPDDVEGARAASALDADPLTTVVGKVRDRRSLLLTLASSHPDAVVLDALLEGETAGIVRDVLQRQPTCTIVVTGTGETAPQFSRAVVAGARGFVVKPYGADQLVNVIRDGYSTNRMLQDSLKADQASAVQGAVVSVYSPKGGVGTTTTAIYLAVAIAARTKANVGLIDLDLQFGDVGVVLDLQGANDINDIIDFATLEPVVVEDVFMKHRSGVRALLAPRRLEGLAAIEGDKVLRLLTQLRQHFAYTVVDTSTELNDVTIAALTAADRVILVTTPDIPSLRRLRRMLTEREQLDLQSKGLILVNRYSSRFGLQLGDIEAALSKPVSMTLASEGMAITQAINQGAMLTGRIGEAFDQIAQNVLGEIGERHEQMQQAAAVAAS